MQGKSDQSRLKTFYFSLALVVSTVVLNPVVASAKVPIDPYIENLDQLSNLQSFYKHFYIEKGRVISPDEGRITTSEGQGYAMLRAVWSHDRKLFIESWEWTKSKLQVRQDKLFAWKWKEKVIDQNAATDADTDIALALILASRKFQNNVYLQEAQKILRDIWAFEVLQIQNRPFLTAGNWAPHEKWPTVHTAYCAPYAYEVFAQVDSSRPWRDLIKTCYEMLNWIYNDRGFKLPPEILYLDKNSGQFLVEKPEPKTTASQFSYDAFPIFWRVALDQQWFGRKEDRLREKMLSFFRDEWKRHGRIVDRYSIEGEPQSKYEAQPLYATLHSLALKEDPNLALEIKKKKIDPLWSQASSSPKTPYYLQNWLWFDRALQYEVTRHYEEFLGFLRPFHYDRFSSHFPWWIFGFTLLSWLLAHRWYPARLSFIALSIFLCLRYLHWRFSNTLNFVEPSGPFVSGALLIAEVYCFSTVALLLLQVGPGKSGKQPPRAAALPEKDNPSYQPSVDILIPIYSEPLEILENTLYAAIHMDYPNKKVYVCDDSHQESVKELTEKLGGFYIRGPKKHAKAGNMNNALKQTSGELVVIFDTDHIPLRNFLTETVPPFADSKIGFVQTPHHFYNEDIFQRAFFLKGRIPNEQDMFNHGIQSGRDTWGGAFFVGSGAVFRRKAVEEIGGFNTMSITEDIHTSQHLHARGWLSRFIDKDLAVGLTAENLSSYLVQRRRWMLGCLQIFFKDNPLLMKGLSLRQKLGYFSSLYYFLFPPIRLIFLLTPLLFLLFHWHPIFAELSILLAYLIPFFILLPLLSSALLPKWPRMFWGTVYENIVALPLARSMFDLFLPKNLGFKVTPKGLVTEKRTFDFQSSKLTLIIASITLFAILKGLWEFYFFQIEKDAYFFNLAWSIYNFFSLLMALAVAWENPQTRNYDRLDFELPFEFQSLNFSYKGLTTNASLSGIGFDSPKEIHFPADGELVFAERADLKIPVKAVHNRRHGILSKNHQVGFEFHKLSAEIRRELVLYLFTTPKHWEKIHQTHVKSNFGMFLEFCRGIYKVIGSLLKPIQNFGRKKL